ncbi:MAG: hypothetical protein KC589_04445 [Nanoarchaeota archaeon]|nr:hypothetical protein [Nanoarchaeota archaeon]
MLFQKFKSNSTTIIEENISIKTYGNKISKELTVFYNPQMKLNRDISLLVLKTYFNNFKAIKFCDPMAASGIRELRFLKTIPEIFETITMGDISKTAIKNIKKNAKTNKISLKKIKLETQNAINTIAQNYYHAIELDPFGSPLPYIDISCQRIKHEGILSITATDTATLCGTYPKKTLRKYGIKIIKTFCFEELGLRNLIAYCQRQGAKYDKNLTPILSYSQDHYYKIFFKVEDGRKTSLETIKKLKYINYNIKTQDINIEELETKDSLGKTYIGPLNNKDFIKEIKTKINLISENKKVTKLLEKLENEIDELGYYNPHKLQKEFKIGSEAKFETIENKLKKNGFKVSRPHNNRLGIKTNAKAKDIIKILKEN